MTFRDKAREVREAGASARGNYAAQGAPLRAYNYWLKHSSSSYAYDIRRGDRRENFCHYWRVVAIWAPLTKLRIALGPVGRWVNRHDNAILGVLLGIGVLVVAFGVGFMIWSIFTEFGWMGFVYGLAWVAGAALVLAVGFGFIWCVATLIETLSAYFRARSRARTEAWAESIDWDNYEPESVVEKPRKEPGRISKFFSGIVDFLILFAQVVRVNKWKICPLVDVSPKVNFNK